MLRGRSVLAGEEDESLSSGLEHKALAPLVRPLVGVGVSHGFGPLAGLGALFGFVLLAGLAALLQTLSGLGAWCTGGGVCSESDCRSWEHTSMLAAGFGFGGAGATLELVKPRLWEASVVVVEPSPSWVCNTVAGRLCTALPAIIGSAVVAKIGAPAY